MTTTLDHDAALKPADDDALGADPNQPLERKPAASAFDKLRDEHARAIADTTFEMNVPTFGGKLVARHRALDYKETEAIAKAVALSKHPKKILLGMADTIIRSCEELLWKEDPAVDNIEAVPLADELAKETGAPEEPVRFEERLGNVLGFPSKTARGVLLDTFGKDMAVVSYYNELTSWMEHGRRKAADEFEGES